MLSKQTLEKIIKYTFFTLQALLFAGVTIYFFVIGKGFGLRTIFWFIVFSMPLCIIVGIITIIIEKKYPKK
ncbi:MAG: hypothetical protein LBI28_02625 [Treponema sp.]|nr:hypothetical protein [Treponema sp.]